MLNYDANGVAEVMGIAFLQSSHTHSPAGAPPPKRSSASRPGTGQPEADFVILVDGDRVLMAEIKTNNTITQFAGSTERVDRNSDFTGASISPPTSALIEKAVERGLPRQTLRHVAGSLAGGDKAKAALLEWGVVPKTTLERRGTRLSPQESERTERIARLFVHARRALGTEAEAREFMTAPHPELDERSPLEASRTDLGARRTEQLLNALEYGLAL